MRLAITGAHGFLGWHLSCRLLATRGVEAVRLGREEFGDPDRLREALSEVDVVVHVAGVNRAETDDDVERGNIDLAERLVAALGERPVHVVYANTVQCERDNAYGRGKRRAGEILGALPGTLADVVLPNLFGEHGRPGYNSFVATFAHGVAAGRQPTITADNGVALLHAQDAAEALIAAGERREDHQVWPEGQVQLVSEVLAMLQGFHGLYAERGEMPDVADPFARDLFNTYRACLFPHGYPIHPQTHADQRGVLVETVRSHGGTGQGFVSSTVPGALRGDHWHLRKIERFMVVRGEAEIALRRLYGVEVVRFRVSGERPGFVDMPTMWTHNITNIGEADVTTVFWADQLLDLADPDQYPLPVELTGSAT